MDTHTKGFPKPETASQARSEVASKFVDNAKAAYNRGAWQTDRSRHTVDMTVNSEELKGGTTLLTAQPGKRTLRLAYFFSGVKRKASIGEELRKLCEKEGIGLRMYEVDILVGGSEHDLLDRASQDRWMARIESGGFDVVILSPPCGSWSRANYSDKPGPKPVRSRASPWGLPGLRHHDQVRARNGNEFVHFSIRAVIAAQACKRRGRRATTLWEHELVHEALRVHATYEVTELHRPFLTYGEIVSNGSERLSNMLDVAHLLVGMPLFGDTVDLEIYTRR